MKKLFVFILCLTMCLVPCLAAGENVTESTAVTTEATTQSSTEVTTKKTEETTKKTETTTKREKTTNKAEKEEQEKELEKIPEVTEDMSQPRLMVTGYNIKDGYLTPEKDGVVSVTLKNMHNSKSVKNIKLSLSEETDEICPDGLGTKYVSAISAGNTYTWDISVKTIHNATVGVHKLNFICEYEDKNGTPYSENATLRVEVRQPVKLTFDGATLPVKVVQEDTVTLNINLMNTGKSTLYNCMVEYDIDGLESGGSSFAGEIPSGESGTATANLRVDSEKTGEVSGVITITYEDVFGKEYKEEQAVKTLIEKKVEKAEKQEEEEPKNPLWWLFILVGLIVGGGAGFGIPFAINSKKQREEDEKRL
ncbi:MAG: hypothetical protein IJ025_03330 [Clostridia bacterium]|nr:hypothetical protein [Clostridia bacterium]